MDEQRSLRVEIVAFVDAAQPGWVEARLVDARGRVHVFVEKVPVLSEEALDAASSYPRSGMIVCTVQNEDTDEQGRWLVDVDTEWPYGIASTEGETRFVVLNEQLAKR